MRYGRVRRGIVKTNFLELKNMVDNITLKCYDMKSIITTVMGLSLKNRIG